MIIRVCAWHAELPRPRRWFRILGVRRWWVVWRFSVSHGQCVPCQRRFRESWRTRRARPSVSA